ncbi:hypothetical protein ACJO5Y_16395 [Marinobacter sp. GN3S48]|uniref:hypothetical protein n=1 Tax=Marinobacter sp. GN3S48 TaxID=3382302 RepID=UPI00387B8B30
MSEDVPTYPFMIIAALLGGLFLFANARMSRYREAASKFRETIEPTISKLNHSEGGTTAILEADFEKHEQAVREFSRYLAFSKKQFLGCWRDYAFHPEAGIHFLEAYSSVGVSVSKAKSNRELAISKLTRLVNYAKP